MAEGLTKVNEIRAKNFEKRWIYRQKIQYTYGSDNDDNNDQLSDDDASDATQNEGTATSTTTYKKDKCKCGSTNLKYISYRECPLNKNKRQIHDSDEMDNVDNVDDITSTDKELAEIFCTCKSQWGTHS